MPTPIEQLSSYPATSGGLDTRHVLVETIQVPVHSVPCRASRPAPEGRPDDPVAKCEAAAAKEAWILGSCIVVCAWYKRQSGVAGEFDCAMRGCDSAQHCVVGLQ